MQGRLGMRAGLVPNLYFVSPEKMRVKNANNVPLSPPSLATFRGENSFYVRFLETDSRNLLKRGRETRGWRILSAALIDVTPKSRRNLKSAAKCARSMSELQLPSFHEVMPEVHTSEKESGTSARLHCPRRGHTRRRQNPVQRGLCAVLDSTEIGKKVWLFAKLQSGRARKGINAT